MRRQATDEGRRTSTSIRGTDMVQQQIKNKSEARDARCVVIIYETPSIREHAVKFCEHLVESGLYRAMEMNWWPFHVLGESTPGGDAAQKAAEADIVVFAMNSSGDLPDEIKRWIECWLNKRGEREGAVVGLLSREEPHEMASFRQIYLRHVARRAGMDYLSHTPPTDKRAIPDSLDSFTERAARMTSVLDKILHEFPRTPPPRL